MADKALRIQRLIQKNISEIIQMEIKDPHLGFVSIPEVKVSKDLSYAKVYVAFINENEAKEGMKVLEKSKGFIRSELAKRMDTRRVSSLMKDIKKSKESLSSYINSEIFIG